MYKLQHLLVTLLVPIICHLVLVRGAAIDWVGTWTDPVWGGKIYICVTTVSNINYAMAGMSNIGYLKGTIDANDVFSGNYYIQGREQRRGSITMTMSSSTSASAVLKDAGNVASYSHSATTYTKESPVEPTDFQCLRTDDDWVAGNTQVYMTGTFQQVIPWDENNLHISYDDGETRRSSYKYDVEVIGLQSDIYDGYIVGKKFENGLVSMENWYENTYMGIEISIFKNETAFYLQWIYAPAGACDHSSQFVYANLKPGGTVSFGTNLKIKISPDYTNYDKWHCYQLQFSSELQSCLGNADSGTSTTMVAAADDDVASNTEKATYATLSFGVVNFVLIIVAIIVAIMMKQKVLYVSGGAHNEMQKVGGANNENEMQKL